MQLMQLKVLAKRKENSQLDSLSKPTELEIAM
jgi:hypothetical protein